MKWLIRKTQVVCKKAKISCYCSLTIINLEIILIAKCRTDVFMKAFVMKEIDNVAFMEKSVPEAGPYYAIVKTNVALVCTSDSHTVHRAIGQRKNLTLGHEATDFFQS